MRIVRVALPVPLPQLFDYTSGDVSGTDLGRCVRVPFGRGEKSGLIVALPAASEVEPARLKPVGRIQRELPALPADWLELVAFVARYYHAPLGEVVALALPPGLRRADEVSAAEADPLLAPSASGLAALQDGGRASRARALLQQLAAAASPLRRSQLRALPGGEAVGDCLRRGWLEVVAADADRHRMQGAPALTAEQEAAVRAVLEAPAGFSTWLLHGVTGSGKTEV